MLNLKSCPGTACFGKCGKIVGKLVLKNKKKTPTYQEYFLCDKHFHIYDEYSVEPVYSWNAVLMTNGELREVKN